MKKILGAAIMILCFAFLGTTSVSADGKSAPYIGISPAKSAIELKPGQTTTGQFRVSNVGEGDFEYYIEVGPYQVAGENYDVDLVTQNNYTRITEWITIEGEAKTGTLKPHSSSDYITYKVTVPEDIPAGSQFAVIKATAVNPTDDSTGFTIENRTSAGMIVYATVDGGSIRKEAKILENKFPTFLSAGPFNASALVENNGNVYAEAKYTLKVTSIFSDEDVLYNNEDEEGTTSIILPETKRLREQSWQNVPMIGIFKVKQTVRIFDEYSEVENIVIVCPFWLIVVFILFIIFVVFYLRSKIKARKKGFGY